ncbi:MAG: alkaline phosphatase D family protein [Caldimonas sp.]
MATRRRPRRLQLGPVVGHTDDTSTRIWIQVGDDPSLYRLRVEGVGLFTFDSTGPGSLEFGTAIARVGGLRPDLTYRYRVTRAGRFVPGASGTVRTLPPAASMTHLLFCAISCNGAEQVGAWDRFADFVEASKPSFVLMMGDQVYLDEDEPDVFATHFDSDPATRRRAMADMYRTNWSREPLRRVLANVPCYMVWDDHDIRDGFGSLAGDSPTLAARHPRGAAIFRKSTAYFEDARDVYWHFQGCRNPLPGDHRDPTLPSQIDPAFPNYVDAPIPSGLRVGMPFVFRCGRLLVMVLDSRGDRDVFRADKPILGARQWQFVDEVFSRLPDDVDALAVVTATPLASQDPDGQTQRLMGQRTDDVEAFRKGDEEALFHPESSDSKVELVKAIISAKIVSRTGFQPNFGAFQISNLDEARDQWSHRFARAEQKDLVKKAFAARRLNRNAASPRALIFLSGDIHIGCIFDLKALMPPATAVSLTASGISQIDDTQPLVGTFIDESFSIAPGIRSTLRDVVNQFNFGVVQVQPTGRGAELQAVLAHEGNGFAFGLDVKDLI